MVLARISVNKLKLKTKFIISGRSHFDIDTREKTTSKMFHFMQVNLIDKLSLSSALIRCGNRPKMNEILENMFYKHIFFYKNRKK